MKLANNKSEQRTITVFMFSLPLVKPKPAEISVAHFTPPQMGRSMLKVIKQEKINENSETVSKYGSKCGDT